MSLYERKVPLVSKLFRNRIKTALKLASINDDSIMLDVGCNFGYLLMVIRNQNCLGQYYGIDNTTINSETTLKNCNFRIEDVRNMKFNDNYFDVVFLLDVLEHIEDVNMAIKQVYRVLKPKGLAILSGPTESWFYKLCRLLWLGKVHFSDHKHSIYDIETKFESNNFKLIKRESMPRRPLPSLFRISKFKKIH